MNFSQSCTANSFPHLFLNHTSNEYTQSCKFFKQYVYNIKRKFTFIPFLKSDPLSKKNR